MPHTFWSIFLRVHCRTWSVRGNRRSLRVQISAQHPAAAQPPRCLRHVGHVHHLPTQPAQLRHQLLHSGMSALRMAGPRPAGRDRGHHAHNLSRSQAPASRPRAGLRRDRPDHGGASCRLLGDVLPAVPQAASPKPKILASHHQTHGGYTVSWLAMLRHSCQYYSYLKRIYDWNWYLRCVSH